MTQTDLAHKAGVSRDTLSRIINERGGFHDSSLAKIAKALNRPLPSITGALDARLRGAGRAHGEFMDVMREVMAALAVNQPIPPGDALSYVTRIWNAATAEAPQLMRPAVNDEGGAGGNAAGG
jgi:transcriptional regulator with XRE-family HTH domain